LTCFFLCAALRVFVMVRDDSLDPACGMALTWPRDDGNGDEDCLNNTPLHSFDIQRSEQKMTSSNMDPVLSGIANRELILALLKANTGLANNDNPGHMHNNNNRNSAARNWKNPALYKTTLCDQWAAGEQCRFGQRCWFAHGQAELRYVPRLDRPMSTGLDQLAAFHYALHHLAITPKETTVPVEEFSWSPPPLLVQPSPITMMKENKDEQMICDMFLNTGFCIMGDQCQLKHSIL